MVYCKTNMSAQLNPNLFTATHSGYSRVIATSRRKAARDNVWRRRVTINPCKKIIDICIDNSTNFTTAKYNLYCRAGK
jgi:hypothetical protein